MTRCIEAVNQIAAVWDTCDDEDKRGMAHYLFSEIVYNLDTRRIESYKLKPWTDDFLMLRMELYYNEFGDLTEGSEGYQQALVKEHSNELLGCWNAMPHRGLYTHPLFDNLAYAAQRMIIEVYAELLLPSKAISRVTLTKCERNEEIRLRHRRGESLTTLANVFGLTEQRVWQIVRSRRK